MYTLKELEIMMKELSLGELADIRDGFRIIATAIPLSKNPPYWERASLAQRMMTKKVEEV